MRQRLGVLAVLAMVTSFPAISVRAAANNEQGVRNVVAGFETSWNRHDMTAFGKLFAPDADFVNVAGAPMKGRQDIQMHHAWSQEQSRRRPRFPEQIVRITASLRTAR